MTTRTLGQVLLFRQQMEFYQKIIVELLLPNTNYENLKFYI